MIQFEIKINVVIKILYYQAKYKKVKAARQPAVRVSQKNGTLRCALLVISYEQNKCIMNTTI